MGYFDALTESSFNHDSEGRRVFFPWGVVGRGVIIPDVEKGQRIRSFLRIYNITAFALILGLGTILGWEYPLAILPILLMAYAAVISWLTAGMDRSEERLTLTESYATQAKSHHPATLWFLFICSLLFTVVGIIMTITGQWLVGVGATVFFGLGSFVFHYMLKLRMG